MLNPKDYEDCKTGQEVHRRIIDKQMQMEKNIENERYLYEQWAINKIKEKYPYITDRFVWEIFYSGKW